MVKTKNSIEVSRSISIVIADSKGNPNRITADATGNLPESIEVLRVGMWRTPYHGDIMIMPEDLTAYVNNFNAGIARADDGKLGLPINFAHESWEKAAGWMTELYVEGNSLMAKVTWTEAGKQGLQSGEWKCFSPEFCPAGRGGWVDPLDEENYIENVLEGGALTNIPLFRNMKPIMASASFGDDRTKPNVFLVTASLNNERENMDLKVILAKTNDELSEDEKNFLAENKDQLTDEQKTAFGFEVVKKEENKEEGNPPVAENTNKEDEATVAPELASVAASIKAGTHVVVKADTLARLEETDQQYRTEKAENIVKAHIQRGAIKADQLDKWTGKLVNASAADRKDLEEMLDGLNGNTQMADASGSDANAGNVTGSAIKKVEEEAQKLIKASRESGKEIDLQTAYLQVFSTNKELEAEYNEEVRG